MKRLMPSFEWRRSAFESDAPSTARRAVPLPRFAGADISLAMSPTPPPPRDARSPSPASRGRTNHQRLYLVTPQLGDTEAFARDIGATLDSGDIAALLLRLEPAGERILTDRVKTVAAAVQRRDIALVLDGYPEIVVRAGADGAHAPGSEALNAGLPALKPDRIAGAGGLHSRHDAMLAAEAGADYVMFGEPDRRRGRPPFAAIVERIAWWSELFELPCIGYAASLDEVAPIAQAKADFIALGDWIWTQGQAPAAVAAAAAQLSLPRPQAVQD
jgi:thiamine-phosphate pyrophosphorylase